MSYRWEKVSTGGAAGDCRPGQQGRRQRAIGAAVAGLLALTACSKTVRWEEEVPLNTGEVIWVKRTVVYGLEGEAGNPLKIGYQPQWEEELLEFHWGGRSYRYKGGADLMLLAISPRGTPVLVAPAGNRGWDHRHNFPCAIPHYVQLMPDANGRNWTWPQRIEPWLYGMSRNLMSQRRNPDAMKGRYTSMQRADEDAVGKIQFPNSHEVNPSYSVNYCKGVK